MLLSFPSIMTQLLGWPMHTLGIGLLLLMCTVGTVFVYMCSGLCTVKCLHVLLDCAVLLSVSVSCQ